MDNIADQGEPRRTDKWSVEAEYEIEYPLKGERSRDPTNARALELFSESVQRLHDGDESRASALYQAALQVDPSLHAHARDALANLANNCNPEDEGAIYYWLGIHAQYLEDYHQAGSWYAKAVDAFHKIGYLKREGRARCNLGRIKMAHQDPSAMEEFEKAIALNPKDGIAHIDIATVYFFANQHERALDAFAEAVFADPARYGPVVTARLKRFGYTWKEDMEKISQRMAKKQGMDLNTLSPSEREAIFQANQYFQIGNGFFQSNRYEEALEQFELGISRSKKFPGNFFGICMLSMQMIEVGAIPEDQIPSHLEKADQNIDECLRIAPLHLDYLEAKSIINDYKKKYHV